VDALNAERGQALLGAVLLLAVAALAVAGIAATGERIVGDVRDTRAGEAAVAAAGAAVADLQVARLRELGRSMDTTETALFAAEDRVGAAASEAAARMARAHARADPTDVVVRSFGLEIEVHLTLAGRHHVALLEPPP
jgi:hypothetical protein